MRNIKKSSKYPVIYDFIYNSGLTFSKNRKTREIAIMVYICTEIFHEFSAKTRLFHFFMTGNAIRRNKNFTFIFEPTK